MGTFHVRGKDSWLGPSIEIPPDPTIVARMQMMMGLDCWTLLHDRKEKAIMTGNSYVSFTSWT